MTVVAVFLWATATQVDTVTGTRNDEMLVDRGHAEVTRVPVKSLRDITCAAIQHACIKPKYGSAETQVKLAV
jgi:hypothetical protein